MPPKPSVGPTPREGEILALMAEGYTRTEIATVMWVTPSTVKSQTRNLVKRLGARNRVHAVAIAYQRGYLTTPPGPSRG